MHVGRGSKADGAKRGRRGRSSSITGPLMAYWSVARTAPRHERFAAERLAEAAYQTYLPVVREQRVVRGRRTAAVVPLFPPIGALRRPGAARSGHPVPSRRGRTRASDPRRAVRMMTDGLRAVDLRGLWRPIQGAAFDHAVLLATLAAWPPPKGTPRRTAGPRNWGQMLPTRRVKALHSSMLPPLLPQ